MPNSDDNICLICHNVQNEIDIRSDTSHNHSCAFVVFFKKTKLLYKGKHAKTPEHNIRKKQKTKTAFSI